MRNLRYARTADGHGTCCGRLNSVYRGEFNDLVPNLLESGLLDFHEATLKREHRVPRLVCACLAALFFMLMQFGGCTCNLMSAKCG